MEGLIFILFFAFVAFVIFGSKTKLSKTSVSKYSEPHDILQAKWNAESQKRNRVMKSTESYRGTGERAAEQEKSRSFQDRKQSRDANNRDRDQTKEMARSGDGAPKDLSFNRRDDWGRRGNMGGGFLVPFTGSLIVAGALAALLAFS